MLLFRWIVLLLPLIVRNDGAVQFPVLSPGESYIVRWDECNGGSSVAFPVFPFLKYLLSFLQPADGPSELIQLLLSRSVPTEMSTVLRLVHLEIGYLILGTAVLIIMLLLPCILLTQVCCSEYDLSDYDKSSRVCQRTLIFVLQILIVCVIVCIVGMVSANEEMSTHLRRASHMSRSALEDVSTFVNNAQVDIHAVVMNSYDLIFANIDDHLEQNKNFRDFSLEESPHDFWVGLVEEIATGNIANIDDHLEHVENLLGAPIQKEIAKETGIDVALVSLMEVALEIKKLSEKIGSLLDDCQSFKDKTAEVEDKLKDVRSQILLFKKQCPERERMLCETIEGDGLDIGLRLGAILQDKKLQNLRQWDTDMLILDVHKIRNEFVNLPLKIAKDSREKRTDVKHELIVLRRMLEDAVSAVKKLSKDLTQKIFLSQRKVEDYSDLFDRGDFWRWTVGIGCSLMVLLLWTVLITGVCYSCCADSYTASSILSFYMVLLSLVSPILWGGILLLVTLAGHVDLILCSPLTAAPDYRVLSKFVDDGGSGNYFLSSYVYNNNSFNVPLRELLNECAQNRPIYDVVNLGSIFNVDKLSEQSKWSKLNLILDDFHVNVSNLQISTPHLNNQLLQISVNLDIDFAQHRALLTGELTRKHVDSFADQLENIANQIKDLATVSRLETLTTRIKRISVVHLEPLEKLKENLIFQMTALELSTVPLHRQLNQSISHLKTIQYFVREHAVDIATTNTQSYISEIKEQVMDYRKYISHAMRTTVGRCHQIHVDARETTCLFCTTSFNMLNMFWLCMLLAVVTLYVCAFVAHRLVICLKKQLLSNITVSNGHVMRGGGSGWNTPRISGERSNW